MRRREAAVRAPVGRRKALVRTAVTVGSSGAALLAAHSVGNAALLRTPSAHPPPTAARIAVLIPCRDEEDRIEACLASVLASVGVPGLRVHVLDDASSDATCAVVRAVAGNDPRVLLTCSVDEPPPGWLGKTWACQRLTRAALAESEEPPDLLVLLDADVRLEPHALAATAELVRAYGLDLVSPYPRQVAVTPTERLVQPLLQWSWLTFLPLRAAERSARPSLSAANGQFLAVRAAAYLRSGGHAAIRDEVLDDVALLRAVKRTGGRGTVVAGTGVATCRMYSDWAGLREGYTKSLWAAWSSPAGAVAASGLLLLLYVLPPAAALAGSRVGLTGYLAAVAGRAVAARRTGDRVLPDALAHPASVALLTYLTASSVRGHRRGSLTWRGRVLP